MKEPEDIKELRIKMMDFISNPEDVNDFINKINIPKVKEKFNLTEESINQIRESLLRIAKVITYRCSLCSRYTQLEGNIKKNERVKLKLCAVCFAFRKRLKDTHRKELINTIFKEVGK